MEVLSFQHAQAKQKGMIVLIAIQISTRLCALPTRCSHRRRQDARLRRAAGRPSSAHAARHLMASTLASRSAHSNSTTSSSMAWPHSANVPANRALVELPDLRPRQMTEARPDRAVETSDLPALPVNTAIVQLPAELNRPRLGNSQARRTDVSVLSAQLNPTSTPPLARSPRTLPFSPSRRQSRQ